MTMQLQNKSEGRRRIKREVRNFTKMQLLDQNDPTTSAAIHVMSRPRDTREVLSGASAGLGYRGDHVERRCSTVP